MTDILLYAVPFFGAMMALELVVGFLRARSNYELRDTTASLSMGFGNLVISLLTKGASFGVYLVVYEFRLFELGNAAWVWIAAFVAQDFAYYCLHRASHEIRFFWAAHVTHHSSQHYNLSTALRQTWTGEFNSLLFYAPLVLLGFHPWMVVTASALNLLYQFWIHTEQIRSLGPLEWVLNTPSHHRVHHGSNVEYLDRNHAGTFIVWDRLFGTFEPEKAPVVYGLTRNIETFNPIRIAFHEWADMIRDVRGASSWSDRLGYLFRPPGWSPDGSTRTAREIRSQLQDRRESRSSVVLA